MELVREDLRDASAGASNLKFNERIKKLQSEGKKIHHLGFGQSPFPIPSFAQDELKKYAHVGEYLPIAGLPALREAACKLHQTHDGLTNITVDDVIMGPGSKELIYQVMNIIAGDVILISPTWTTYAPQARLARKQIFVIPTSFEDGWKLTADGVNKKFEEEQIKDGSLIILCNPDNPTGASYTPDEFRKLSEAFRKHKMLVLSDEIYSRLSFNEDHVSMAKFYPEGTILSSGISKWASCGGWRLGYLIFPPQLKNLREVLAGAASQTYTTVSAPIQHAAIRLLAFDEEGKSYARHCSRILKTLAEHCCRKLREVGVKVHMSGSGYYIFPDFEVIRESLKRIGMETGAQMCDKLLEQTSVALMPGGPHYLHPPEALTVRLCYVNFDGTRALRASEEIGLNQPITEDFLHEYCASTVEAIKLIADWVMKVQQGE